MLTVTQSEDRNEGQRGRKERKGSGGGGRGPVSEARGGTAPQPAGAGASSRLTPAFELSLRLLQGPGHQLGLLCGPTAGVWRHRERQPGTKYQHTGGQWLY